MYHVNERASRISDWFVRPGDWFVEDTPSIGSIAQRPLATFVPVPDPPAREYDKRADATSRATHMSHSAAAAMAASALAGTASILLFGPAAVIPVGVAVSVAAVAFGLRDAK